MSNYNKFCHFSKSEHFKVREQQRGFSNDAIDLLMEFGDCIAEVGGGYTSITLSHEALQNLDPDLRHSKAAEKAAKAALVINGDVAVTVTNLDDAKQEDRYRGKHKNGHPHRPPKQRKPNKYMVFKK